MNSRKQTKAKSENELHALPNIIQKYIVTRTFLLAISGIAFFAGLLLFTMLPEAIYQGGAKYFIYPLLLALPSFVIFDWLFKLHSGTREFIMQEDEFQKALKLIKNKPKNKQPEMDIILSGSELLALSHCVQSLDGLASDIQKSGTRDIDDDFLANRLLMEVMLEKFNRQLTEQNLPELFSLADDTPLPKKIPLSLNEAELTLLASVSEKMLSDAFSSDDEERSNKDTELINGTKSLSSKLDTISK